MKRKIGNLFCTLDGFHFLLNHRFCCSHLAISFHKQCTFVLPM